MNFYREAALRVRIRNNNFTGYIRELTFSGLRVSFSITKSLAWSTNAAVIKIWNLGQSNRNLIKDYGDEVTLYAGYSQDSDPRLGYRDDSRASQVLFIGDTTAVSHIYEQPEIITVLECGDGDKFINQLRVSVSYAAGTPARTVIHGIASQMGINISLYAASDNLEYRQGFKFIGMGKDALTIVCNYLGLQWSVQNNALQIIPLGGTNTLPIIQINQNTGMQGVPTRFTNRRIDLYRSIYAPTTGYKINVALNPLILPGSEIALISTHLGVNGPYRVENVRHEGDTYGFVWSSNLEVTELTGGPTL